MNGENEYDVKTSYETGSVGVLDNVPTPTKEMVVPEPGKASLDAVVRNTPTQTADSVVKYNQKDKTVEYCGLVFDPLLLA